MERYIIGLLDSETRLVSTQLSFNIEVKEQRKNEKGELEDFWFPRYFHSDIQSAIRAYAKYKTRRLARDVSKAEGIKDILAVVTLLDQAIRDVGIRLEEAWKTSSQYDPVEDACKEQ